jgi:hypothetical protein
MNFAPAGAGPKPLTHFAFAGILQTLREGSVQNNLGQRQSARKGGAQPTSPFMSAIRTPVLAWLLLATFCPAQEKPNAAQKPEPASKTEAPAAPAAQPAAPAPAPEGAAKLDAAQIRRQAMDWVPVDYAAFGLLIEKARAAGVEDMDTLLARLDASLLFGDVDTLKRLLPEAEKAKDEIAKRKGGTASAREEVSRSLKLAKQFLTFAEKRPSEASHRAEMFRMYYFAETTLEHARMLDAALDQAAIEKNLKDGAPIPWEQVQQYLKKDSQLSLTGATIFGDKFGPFVTGTPPHIPTPTYEKLKSYLPADTWGAFAPK